MFRVLPFTRTYCINVIRFTIYTYILYKCYPFYHLHVSLYSVEYESIIHVVTCVKIDKTFVFSYKRWSNLNEDTGDENYPNKVGQT